MENESDIQRDLMDAGLSSASSAIVSRLFQAGRIPDALHEMKKIRCELMEDLHQSQRRVDHLDQLIRQTEKELNTI